MTSDSICDYDFIEIVIVYTPQEIIEAILLKTHKENKKTKQKSISRNIC